MFTEEDNFNKPAVSPDPRLLLDKIMEDDGCGCHALHVEVLLPPIPSGFTLLRAIEQRSCLVSTVSKALWWLAGHLCLCVQLDLPLKCNTAALCRRLHASKPYTSSLFPVFCFVGQNHQEGVIWTTGALINNSMTSNCRNLPCNTETPGCFVTFDPVGSQ